MPRRSDRRSARALRQRAGARQAITSANRPDRVQVTVSPQRLRRSSRVRAMQQKRRRSIAEPTADAGEQVQTDTSPRQTNDDASSIEPTRKKACTPVRDGVASTAVTSASVSRALQLHVLQSAFALEDVVEDTNWLTSGVMDLVFWRLAQSYPSVHFLSTDFAYWQTIRLSRKQSAKQRLEPTEVCVRDLLGRAIDCQSGTRPIVFAVNCELIHWNLLRVQLQPRPELQLFEPMGRLSSRSGISYRSVPRPIVEWLNTSYSHLSTNWLANTVSAITHPQQVSGYDCGIACLLYALRCGQGQSHQQIDSDTDQYAITRFRQELQRQFRPKAQVPILSWSEKDIDF